MLLKASPGDAKVVYLMVSAMCQGHDFGVSISFPKPRNQFLDQAPTGINLAKAPV